MDMRTRKALGCFVLLAYMGVYAAIAATIGAALAPSIPVWAQLAFYAIAGIIWIFPLKPLFDWMNRSS
jgi:membrane protein implicated in regulation of membrane protease activity